MIKKTIFIGAHSAVPELSSFRLDETQQLLLHWWERHGRRDPVQKPWMFTAAGAWPQPHEPLKPYGIWVAEVMLCSAA